MSMSLSNAQATLEMPPRSLPGCFLNVGWTVVVLDDRLVQVADEVGAAALGRLEELQARDVHRVFTGFADEEQ